MKSRRVTFRAFAGYRFPAIPGEINTAIAGRHRTAASDAHHEVKKPALISSPGSTDSEIFQFSFHIDLPSLPRTLHIPARRKINTLQSVALLKIPQKKRISGKIVIK